jgi:hypothetical protein
MERKMDDSLEIQIGYRVHERVVISIKGVQQNLDKLPYNPGTLPWLNVEIRVYAGVFEGTVADIMSIGQIRGFCTELSNLYESLEGNAGLGTILGLFSVDLKGNGSGYILALFEIDDDFVYLRFGIGFDQTFLPPLMDQVKRVIAAYDELKSD